MLQYHVFRRMATVMHQYGVFRKIQRRIAAPTRLLLLFVLGQLVLLYVYIHQPPPPPLPPLPALRPPAYDGVLEIPSPFLVETGQVIGYACAGNCGSWADQQTGIVTAYVISVVLGKRFKIDLRSPCDLGFFLSPKDLMVDWRLKPGELQGREVARVRRLDEDGVVFAQEFLALPDPQVMFQEDYVFLSTNVDVVDILRKHELAQNVTWLQQRTVAEIYHKVLTDLFSLMPGPRAVVDSVMDSVPAHSQLVCAQIHVGDEEFSESLKWEGHLSRLLTFLTSFNHNSSSSSFPNHFLFTSDNPHTLERAQNYFPSRVVKMERPITHSASNAGNDVCRSVARAIVEQVVLSKCKVLVISEDGLARIAAFLRNTDHGLYLLRKGLVLKVSRKDLFPRPVLS